MNTVNNGEHFADMYEESDEIDLLELLFLIWNNLHTIIISAVLFLLIGILVAMRQPDVYQANALLMVTDANYMLEKLDKADLSLNQELVSTYTEIAKNREISRRMINKYDINLSSEQMRKKIKVSPVGETEFINISYTDTNPGMAAMVANEIAREFMMKVEEVMGVQNLKVVEKAFVPKIPTGGKKKLIVATAFVLGGFLGVFIVFLEEFLRGYLKKSQDFSRILGSSVVGYIPDFDSLKKKKSQFFKFGISKKSIKDDKENKLFFLDDLNTPMAESFRNFKNNLKLDRSKSTHVVAFTSSVPEEGKTTICSNYALSQALSGKKVLLIDCDMRKSRLEKLFDIDKDKKGLYTYLNGDFPIEEVIIDGVHKNLDIIIAEKNRDYIPEMLHKKDLHDTFKELRESYDLIILDTPPMGITSDVGVLVEYIDELVMVCGYDMISRKRLNFINESLKSLGVSICGIVINKIHKTAYSALGHYVSYYDDYYEYVSDKKLVS